MSRILLLLLVLGLGSARAGEKYAAIAFHDVVDSGGKLDEDAVTVDNLIQFFEWLRANDWNPITIDDIAAARAGKKPLPKRPILITFDDGYRSLYTRVYPLILAYRIPIVIAIAGSWLDAPMDAKVKYGDTEVPRDKFITWEEAREMAGSGLVEFASHAYDLHRGTQVNPQGNTAAIAKNLRYVPGRGYESEKEYRARIEADLKKSRDLLADRLGRAPRVMIWPFGRYNLVGSEIAKKLGFEHAFTLDAEPADVSRAMSGGRYLPTNNPGLATMVSNLRFNDELPAAQRFVALDPAALWAGNADQTNERLGRELDRLQTLGITSVVVEGATYDADGRIAGTWFPNRLLPVNGDFLSRIASQCSGRAGTSVFVRLPTRAALQTLGDPRKVRELFRDLGAHVQLTGIFIDDAPGLVTAKLPNREMQMPWEVKYVRRAFNSSSLGSAEELALSAFREVERYRPQMKLALVADPDGPLQPAAIADVTLIPTCASATAAGRIGQKLRDSGWLSGPAARRIGLWFTGEHPPKARDLIAATKRFQTLGGTIIGWAADDPLLGRPAAKEIAPAISAARIPTRLRK